MRREIGSIKQCNQIMSEMGVKGGVVCWGACQACPHNIPQAIEDGQSISNLPFRSASEVMFYPVYLTDDGKVLKVVADNGEMCMTRYEDEQVPVTEVLVDISQCEMAKGGYLS